MFRQRELFLVRLAGRGGTGLVVMVGYLRFIVCGQGGEAVDDRQYILEARVEKPWMVQNISSNIRSGWCA